MTPEDFLADFLDAFNNLETDRFLTFFREDASVFYPMAAYPRRLTGEDRDSAWRAVHDGFRGRPGPPYLALAPIDLLVQVFGDTTIASFHLEGPGALGRRTIALARDGDSWKIVHLHASQFMNTE